MKLAQPRKRWKVGDRFRFNRWSEGTHGERIEGTVFIITRMSQRAVWFRSPVFDRPTDKDRRTSRASFLRGVATRLFVPFTDQGLPFAAGSHESYQAAVTAASSRETKTRHYLRLLHQRGPLTDDEVSRATGWARSSVCSIRGNCMTTWLVEKTGIVRESQYGAKCRAYYLSPAGVAAVKAMKGVA